ncbi:hypothetical protein WQ54_23820 [Bacillus sp. SA1-12]|uniref:hypothetical protein n=1 Tax=Bacillus sp. SA1-12 TaxID=1455638 RepID=UPI000626FC07|nr:hypothetical protein [Bacillus sp. SA1-12]KKI90131.1 hypothetical protein WQ54_23820 [Bacillus sp. SA1-12]
MNFDSKYLIRWGIPGWTYLAVLLIYFFLYDFDQMKTFIFSKDVPIIVASLSLFIGAGVILGHLIHQISLYLGFVIWTKKGKYFKKEYEMDIRIIKSKFGSEIHRIYQYRLGNVHAYRTLCFSLFLSLITLIILSFTLEFSLSIGILILLILLINSMVFVNFIYFQDNLSYFMKKINTDFTSE